MTLDDIRNRLSDKYGNTHHFLGSIELQNRLVIRNPRTHRAVTVVRNENGLAISRRGSDGPETFTDPAHPDALQQIEDWLD
jgi:hypothetical protein